MVLGVVTWNGSAVLEVQHGMYGLDCETPSAAITTTLTCEYYCGSSFINTLSSRSKTWWIYQDTFLDLLVRITI